MNQEQIERAILKFIKAKGAAGFLELTFPSANQQLVINIKNLTGITCTGEWSLFGKAVWSLIARRLVWISTDRSSSEWRVWLTEKGDSVAGDETANPDDPTRFMERLVTASPATSDTVREYLREALKSFAQECYLSSSVMLGVAAEATTLDVADSFVKWSGSSANRLKTILENPRQFYVYKLEEFSKRLAVAKSSIPSDLADNLELNLTAVLQLIRLTRNDAGHATGRKIDRAECFQDLVVYSNAHKKLHLLRQFFEAPI
jgi:hypothetical protein